MVLTNCESGSSPIYITPESMEAGEYGLMRGTCSVTRRMDAAAVAELLWTYWCFEVRRDFVLYLFDFFPSNSHGLLRV